MDIKLHDMVLTFHQCCTSLFSKKGFFDKMKKMVQMFFCFFTAHCLINVGSHKSLISTERKKTWVNGFLTASLLIAKLFISTEKTTWDITVKEEEH